MNKRKLGRKAVSILAAGMMGVCCLATACQPTPEREIVVNKADGKLEGAIHEKSDSADAPQSVSGLYDSLGAPPVWTDEIRTAEGDLQILADAPVSLPDVSQMPAATARRRVFTQEEVNKVGELLFGKDAVYTEREYMTKEHVQSMLTEEQRFLEERKAEGDEASAARAQESIDYLQSLYADAPGEADLKQIDLTLAEVEDPYDAEGTIIGLNAATVMNGEAYGFEVANDLQSFRIGMSAGLSDVFGGGAYVEKPFGVSLTKEQAAEMAVPLAAQLTDELRLSYVGVHARQQPETGRGWGWACVFTREINGSRTTYTVNEVGSDMETTLGAPVAYEQMVIIVDDRGVFGFSWTNPMEIVGVENENVALMPFEEIKKIAVGQLQARYAEYDLANQIPNEGESEDAYFKVTGVQLGLTRVDKRDSGEYYYLPVWDIYNETTSMGSEPLSDPDRIDAQGNLLGGVIWGFAPETWNSVTINAIDGSVVDRNLGH